MSGEKELNPVDQRLAEVENILKEYESSLGLKIADQEDYSRYLNLKQSQLKKMSPEECGEVAFMMAQQSLYIQQEINKHTQRMNWANTNIEIMIAKSLDNYGTKYTPYEIRKTLAINDNEYTAKLYEIFVRAKQFLDKLSYIPTKIGYLSKTLLELQQTKRNQQ